MKKQTNNDGQDKKCLQALKESDERFRNIVLKSPDAIIVTDAKGMIKYMNPAAEKVFNRKLESFVGKDLGLVLVNGESTEIDIVRPGKDPGVGDMYVVETEWLGEKAHLITIRDITKRKQAEEALRENEEKYRWMLDNMADVITVMDMNLRFTYVSPSIIRMRGYTAEEATAQTFEQVMTPESLKISAKVFEEEMRLEASGTADPDRIRIVEVEQYRKDGSIVLMENHLSFMRDEAKKPVGIILVSHDITDRKRTEEALKESEKKYRLLADNVNDVIFVLDMNLNYTYVSPSVKILRGYEPEEVMKQLPSKALTPSSWDLVTKTIAEAMELEKEHREINISWTLQLEMMRKDGTTVWTEVKISVIRDENQRPVSILGITRDITERRKAEVKLQQTLDSLKKAVGATIQVMVSAVEMRDPYTAGHQLRAANLACAIATEMELPQDKIDGLRMAGSIHDIGKLSIPAEILSKPTKLTNIEFSLIKEHSQIGYDMLKDVESSWPLAQIVYQHHERMDGTGYPRNLKGDEILMEARIMAVADVVEAMASHRPYRPGLGIDSALAEIEKNKGIFYDNTVVDACLRLFREKGCKLLA